MTLYNYDLFIQQRTAYKYFVYMIHGLYKNSCKTKVKQIKIIIIQPVKWTGKGGSGGVRQHCHDTISILNTFSYHMLL